MKDYFANKYGDIQLSYNRLRAAVKEAWESIEDWRLKDLIDTMQQRCEDVITAEGGHTNW